jgi:hypothetical protein
MREHVDQCENGRYCHAGGTVTRDAGPVKGGSTEIAFVEVRVGCAINHLRLQPLGCCQCQQLKVACRGTHHVSVLIEHKAVNTVVQDPTGYKYELIQRPEHKGDRILHVRKLLSQPHVPVCLISSSTTS